MPTINFTEIKFTVNGSVNIYIQESGQLLNSVKMEAYIYGGLVVVM